MSRYMQWISQNYPQGDYKRLILFFLVGGLNTIFGYSFYALLLFLHFHYTLALLLATIAGILFNFKTTGVIVFKNCNNRLLLRFITVYSLTYLLNVGGLRIFASFHVNMYLAGAVLVLPIALVSFALLKKFVFGGDKGEIDQRSDSLFQRGR